MFTLLSQYRDGKNEQSEEHELKINSWRIWSTIDERLTFKPFASISNNLNACNIGKWIRCFEWYLIWLQYYDFQLEIRHTDSFSSACISKMQKNLTLHMNKKPGDCVRTCMSVMNKKYLFQLIMTDAIGKMPLILPKNVPKKYFSPSISSFTTIFTKSKYSFQAVYWCTDNATPSKTHCFIWSIRCARSRLCSNFCTYNSQVYTKCIFC